MTTPRNRQYHCVDFSYQMYLNVALPGFLNRYQRLYMSLFEADDVLLASTSPQQNIVTASYQHTPCLLAYQAASPQPHFFQVPFSKQQHQTASASSGASSTYWFIVLATCSALCQLACMLDASSTWWSNNSSSIRCVRARGRGLRLSLWIFT